jgi:type IV pilus assembly protein PilE
MRRAKGFSLIELMTVVLIIAVLATLAYSGYQKQVRKSRRAEAKQALSELALRQEKWRSNNVSYFGTDSSVAEQTAFGAITAGTYYTVAVTTAESGTAYTATATPKAGTDQVNDTCGTLTWALNAGLVTKTSTAGTDCW